MIVLAYEDEPSLPALVGDLNAVLRSLADRHEIVIVDDGSPDDTRAVAAGLVKQYDVVSERHAVNRGVGAAFSTGAQAWRYDIIGYMDGDGQFAPEDIPAVAALLQSADAACGIRARRADPLSRRIISRVYRFVLARIFGLAVPDVNCGLKLFTRRYLEAVGPLESTGSFFDAELLVKGSAAGMRIAAAPVQHFPRRHGTARGASRSSVVSAIDTMTSPGMRRYWQSGLDARVLGMTIKIPAALMRPAGPQNPR